MMKRLIQRLTKKMLSFFKEINTNLQNEIQIVEQREEPRSELRAEVRVETVIPNKNLIKNHLADQIIGSKDIGVMTRNKVQ